LSFSLDDCGVSQISLSKSQAMVTYSVVNFIIVMTRGNTVEYIDFKGAIAGADSLFKVVFGY
jgi:hypothetical protein